LISAADDLAFRDGHCWDLRDRGARSGIAVALSIVTSVFAARAGAQQSSAPLVPVAAPVRAEGGVSGEPGALPMNAAFAPLRLSLVGGLFAQGNTLPGCASREDASGNSLNGFALQRYSYVRLAPSLVLHGFSQGGCAVDAGLGGGLTFSTSITKSLWLISSVGFYALPPLDSARSAFITSAARVDVVKHLGWGRTLSLGLGTRQRYGSSQFNAIHFGGSF
jgi:hypothetical protein